MTEAGHHVLANHDPVLDDFASEVGAEDAVAIAGSRSRWPSGWPLDADVRVVSAPSGIVIHQPEEMLVTVRAGTSVDELTAALAEAGQRCPLPPGGTVGGAIAVGHNCIQRLGRGSVRDSVMQVRYVSADGRLVAGGGPVVKNVSGFNLPKLLTGSLGTLGFVCEVILRTNPIPVRSVVASVADADPFVVFDLLYRPSMVLWDGVTTWVELEGHPDDVDSQLGLLKGLGQVTADVDLPELEPNRHSIAPGDVKSLLGAGARFVASIGVGTVWTETARPHTPLDTQVIELSRRVKDEFDPTGRLNPGLKPWT